MRCSKHKTDETSDTDGRTGDRTGWMAAVPFQGLTHRRERWVPFIMLSLRSHAVLGFGSRLRPTGYEVMRRVPLRISRAAP